MDYRITMLKKDWKNQAEASSIIDHGDGTVEVYFDYQHDELLDLFKDIPFHAASPGDWDNHAELYACDGQDFARVMGDYESLAPMAYVYNENEVDTDEAMNYFAVLNRVLELFWAEAQKHSPERA